MPSIHPPIQFRAPPGTPLHAALSERGESLSLTAKRDLERYYGLLERALRSLAGRFTLAEAALILDAVNGTFWEPHTMLLLWAEIDDAWREGLDGKWGVDGPELVAKIRGLDGAQTWALIDATERWWRQPEPELSPEGLAAVGWEVAP